jgi:L-histidine N-alpha-methyltransferase
MSLATLLDAADLRAAMAQDVRTGLARTPKVLPPKYFYDATGSELFDRITRLPEYYPTRAERSILETRATEIARATAARTLVEIGSGTSEKTRLLLTALHDAGTLHRFVPFDVDPAVLTQATAAIAHDYPGVTVDAVVGDFEKHLSLVPPYSDCLIAFLGSTIGNLEPAARAEFYAAVRTVLGGGGAFLLGTDLVKDAGRLRAAYDDAQGVTAAFDKNVLAVINRVLGANFDLDAFEHVAVWDPEQEWIEMRLRSLRAQQVRIRDLDLDVAFASGEEMRTEISAKFRRAGVEAELAAAGLRLVRWWTDPAGDFALSLSVPD